MNGPHSKLASQHYWLHISCVQDPFYSYFHAWQKKTNNPEIILVSYKTVYVPHEDWSVCAAD